MENKGWIGFDLDGTLAEYTEWKGADHIGKPIEPIIRIAKQYIEQGYTIKIFTARACVPEQIPPVKKWCIENGLGDLEVTNQKDFGMILLYDDRCVQVMPNKGIILKNVLLDFINYLDKMVVGKTHHLARYLTEIKKDIQV